MENETLWVGLVGPLIFVGGWCLVVGLPPLATLRLPPAVFEQSEGRALLPERTP